MPRISYWCDRCMRVHQPNEVCPKRAKKKHHDQRKAAQRHPSRTGYNDPKYRINRQKVLQETKGRCAQCGKQIAERKDGRWKMLCGGIHHIKPLSQGGGNGVRNLLPLCHRCHNRADAALRK